MSRCLTMALMELSSRGVGQGDAQGPQAAGPGGPPEGALDLMEPVGLMLVGMIVVVAGLLRGEAATLLQHRLQRPPPQI